MEAAITHFTALILPLPGNYKWQFRALELCRYWIVGQQAWQEVA